MLGCLAICRMRRRSWQALVVLAVCCVATTSSGDDVVSAKALKYHKLLVSRPEPGYLFDRFYNTWLDESTVDALGTFLQQRADETKATPDQLLLAFFYVKKGDDIAAIQLFEQALAANPGNAATWYHKGLVEARTLDFDSAIADLRKAKAGSPDEKLAVQIDKQLGKLLVRNRQTAEALAVWQALLKSHPNDDELSEDLIELYIDEGLLKEAAGLAESLLKETKDPHVSVMRRLRLGDIHHRAGEREKAIEVYTGSLDDVGTGTWLEREILAQVDQVMRREDDLNGLKRLYDGLATKYPKRVSIHRRRAQLLLELGDNEAGLAAFREVLKLTPGDRPTREEYVTILAKVGKHDDAIKELTSLCEQNAKDAELRFRLASLLQEAKRPDESAAAFDEYLATSDGSEYAYLRAARALERFESKESAERVYREMADKFADSASAQEAFTAFLYAQGQKEDAIKRWQSLAKDADVSQVLHVARALAARNEHQAALDMLQARQQDFAKEPLYLGQLVATAFALKKYDEAIPWSLARVELAEAVTEMETAIDQAATTIERADKLEAIATEQAARSDRSIPETCLLAELWERVGDSARADEVLKQPAADGNVLAVSEQIRLASQRREWSQAADATRRMLDLPGGRKSLYIRRLVELYQRDFQLEEALKWVQEWKRLSPGSTTPWVTESRLLSGLGKSEDALKVLRTAAMQFEEDEDLRVRLAEFYVESGKPADAERIYWQLYEQNEDLNGKLRWAQELAKIAQQEGTSEQIIENFNQRIESNRRSIVPWLSLSEIYRVLDDYEGRRRALTAAAKIKPDDIHLLQQIARVEEQDGDWQAAIKTLERAVPLDKTNKSREQIAQLHLRYGDEEIGFSQLMQLASENSDPRSLELAADTLCGMQDWDRARRFLQERIADHPGDYRLRYLLAVALEEAGETDAAVEQFVTLLENQEELPTKKAGANSPTGISQQSYYGMMTQIMPAQAAEWIELMQYRYTAYAHRQQRSAYSVSSYMAGGGVRSAITMPTTVDAVRPLAMSHALSIGATLDEDKQQELWRVLESHGVEHAAALSNVDPNRGDFTGPLTEILEKDPQNEVALAVMVLQGMNRPDQTGGEHYSRAVEHFRKSHPQLAMMAAVQAGMHESAEAPVADSESESAEPVKNKYLDEALAIAGTLDSPSPIVVMSITSAMGGRPGRNMATPIDEQYRQKFAELMLKWYPKLTNSPWGQYAYYMVIQSLTGSEDPTAYVQFLDDEVGRYQVGSGKSRNQSMQMMFGRSQQQLLSPPSFPPPQLSNFPPGVLSIFSSNGRNSPFGNQIEPPGGIEEPAEKIKPLLAKVKSPVLRILLAHHAELTEVANENVQQMLAAKTPSVDACLIAAGLAAEKENYAEVVRVLEKARYLPMTQDMRRQVDASLVAAVLALKDDAKQSTPELMEAGKQASLRLRRARLDAQQRNELIAAMEDLGLKQEAKKLDELASNTAASASTSSSRVYYSSPAASTPPDRIAKLVADGKREVAVRLLAGEVTSQVQQVLANMQNARHYGYQFRELRQRIDSLGLGDDVLKSLAAGDSKNPRRVLEYAMALQLFDAPDKARAQYERVLELRPKDDAARMYLILLMGNSDAAAATEHIKQLSQPVRDSFAQTLGEQLQDYESTIDERIGFAALALELLKSLKPGEVTQPHGFEYCANGLGRQMHSNRGQGLPSLYMPAKVADEYRRNTASKEVQDKRAKIHDELCRELLQRPETARIGFKHLLAATEAKAEPLDEFADRAQKVLVDEAEAPPAKTAIVQQHYSYSDDGRSVRFRTPEEFLSRRAWKSGDWKLIDETLLPMLDANKTRPAHDELEQMTTLYRCPEGEFLEHAKGIVRRSRPTQPYQSNQGLNLVVDVWADRGLDVDLQPLLLTHLKQEVGSQNHHQPPGYITTYVVAVAKTGREKPLAMLDEIATVYIAPPAKRNDFISKNFQRNMMNYGTPNGRIHVFSRLIEQLCQHEELLFVLLDHLKQYDMSPVQNLEYRVRNALNEPVSNGAAATMEFLEASPWLTNLDEFETLQVSELGNQSALRTLLQNVANTEKVRDELYAKLEERQQAEPTFGGGLILAYLDQQKRRPSLLEYLGKQLPEIQKLPKEQQLELASGAHDLLYTEVLDAKDLNETATAAKAWLTGGQSNRAQVLLARAEKAKRLEELGIEHGQIYQFTQQSFGEAIQSDPAAAAKIFQRVCQLSVDAQKRGDWHMYFGNGNSTPGSMLQQMGYNLRQSSKNWNVYNFLVDVVKNPESKAIEIDHSAGHLVGELVTASLNRAPKQADGKAKPYDQRMRALYEEFGAGIGDRPSSLLIRGLYERSRGELNPEKIEKIRAWTKTESESGKYPRVAADVDATVALIAAEKEEQKPGPGERRELADYHRHFLGLLSDGDLPVTWRVHLAAFVAGRQGNHLPVELAREVIAVHAQAMEADSPITDSQNEELTRIALSLRDEPGSAEVLKDWRSKWADRYLKPRRRQPSYPQREWENFGDLSTTDAICNALTLYYAAGETDRADQLLRKYGEQIGNLPRTLAVLVRARQTEKAAQFVRRNWPVLQLTWPTNDATYYDDEFAKLVPAVYEVMESEDQRYFAKLLFASMPDREPEKKNGDQQDEKKSEAASPASTTPRDLRLAALAEQVGAVKFSDDACHKRVLVLLSGSDVTRDKVADAVAKAFKPENLASAFRVRDDSPRLNQETELAVCHFTNRLQAGDSSQFVELLSRLIAGTETEDYQLTERLWPLLDCCRNSLKEPEKPLAPQDCAAIAAQLRAIFKDRDYVHFNDSQAFNALFLALHSQAGEGEVANKWISTVSENCRYQLAEQSVNDDIWKIGTQLNTPVTPDNLDARVAFVQNALQYAINRKWIRWRPGRPYYLENAGNDNVFTAITKSGLITNDELKTRGDELVGKINNVPLITAGWASWLQTAKEPERSAKVWQTVVDTEVKRVDKPKSAETTKSDKSTEANKKPADGKPADKEQEISDLHASYVLGLAATEFDSGNKAAATEALQLLDGKKVPNSMREAVDKLRKRMKEPLKSAAQPKPDKPESKPGEASQGAQESSTASEDVTREVGATAPVPAPATK